jgi:microcystin-dependent protein
MRRSVLFLLLAGLIASVCPSATQAQATPFLGQIMVVSFNFAPRGWAFCEGQLLPINQNAALFSLLGTTFGGDGVRTFALPDLRGRVPIGMGQGAGLSNRTLGETGGEEQVTWNINQIPSHTHVPMAAASVANSGTPAGTYWAMPRVLLYSTGTPDTSMNALALGTTGGSQPHENRKPFVAMSYVIALNGIYPSRN